MDSRADTPRGVGCPIRTCADQRSLATPRALSQRATSFIASWRQGIHRTPFSRARDRFRRRHRHRRQRGADANERPNPPPTTRTRTRARLVQQHRRRRRRTTTTHKHHSHAHSLTHVRHRAHHVRGQPAGATTRRRRGRHPRWALATIRPDPPSPCQRARTAPCARARGRARRRHHRAPPPGRHRGRASATAAAATGLLEAIPPAHAPRDTMPPGGAAGQADRSACALARRRSTTTRARGRHVGRPTAAGWRRSDSNRRPPACKAGALPLSYAPTGPTPRVEERRRHRAATGGAPQRAAPGRPAPSHPPGIFRALAREAMGQGGLEPPTPRLSSVCSNQLSYWPPKDSLRPAPGGARRPSSVRAQPARQDGCGKRHAEKTCRPSGGMPKQTPNNQRASRGERGAGRRIRPARGPRDGARQVVSEGAAPSSGRNRNRSVRRRRAPPSLKGGDPAAGSPTATLLRLHPSR
jgi:hypothetical protein